MELNKINEIMANRGYTRPIGAIFPKWEFVKDEILLPNRKAGSGNGTVHVYLLEDNMNIFEKCFSEYIKASDKKNSDIEELCPRITHVVQTSNILTVAGFAYHHYNCDANIFNYSDYVNKVMRHDDNGIVSFESLFKLSTERRPYFKQFDKHIFGKIIRYIFVPRKTAYKLYLYSDEERENYAVFWILGQVPDYTFIVGEEIERNKYDNNIKEEPFMVNEDPIIEYKRPIIVDSTPKELEARFKKYMENLGKSKRTINSYVANVRNLVPRAQQMIDGEIHPSPYTITDYNQLVAIDKELWSNPTVVEWNRNDHNRCSAAFHMYLAMFTSNNNVDAETLEESTDEVSEEVSSNDINFFNEVEEQQKIGFMEYLRENRTMSDITIKSYANVLQKRLSNLIRSHYDVNFRNIYAITDYEELINIEEKIWDISEITEANLSSKGKLTASFRAYTEYVGSFLSDEEFGKKLFGDSSEEDDKTENDTINISDNDKDVDVVSGANFKNESYIQNNIDDSTIVTESKGSSFVFCVMRYFEEQFGLGSIVPYISKNVLWGIKLDNKISMPGFFFHGTKEELHERNNANFTSKGLPLKRWYEDPFTIDNKTVYLTNQWHDDEKPGLSINNFEKMIQTCFDEDYYIERIPSNGYALKVRT